MSLYFFLSYEHIERNVAYIGLLFVSWPMKSLSEQSTTQGGNNSIENISNTLGGVIFNSYSWCV
jgi:hypothetical protein